MNVDPWIQLQLLDLQTLDSAIERLAVQRRTLPELADITRLSDRLRTLGGELADAERAKHDSARAQTRLETDVEQVRNRSIRDQERLNNGNITSAQRAGESAVGDRLADPSPGRRWKTNCSS